MSFLLGRSLLIALLLTSALSSHFTWLPLGDSITWGCGNGVLPHEPAGGCEADAASYRIPTAQALEQANITITTVGSVSAGPPSSPTSWRAHEGHPGWRIDQITATADVWTRFNPDVITVLLGANDCLQGDGSDLAIARMDVLLNLTATALPTAKVFVASILDVPAKAKGCQLALNAALPALIKQADGGRGSFFYVPVAEYTLGVCGNDTTTWSIGDGVHPNAGGHARVASVFARWMRTGLCPRYAVDRSC